MECQNDMLGHAFAERTMPAIQEELVKEMLSISREMEDSLDLIEERCFTVSQQNEFEHRLT